MKRRQLLAATLAVTVFSAAAQTPAPRVALDTTQGNIVVELAAQAAPKTVANFLSYVKSGHYDSTVFHRVIRSFMIQGGGYTADLNEKPTRGTDPAREPNGLKNERGTLSMARRGDPELGHCAVLHQRGRQSRLDYPKP